jgi:hypothetical protein
MTLAILLVACVVLAAAVGALAAALSRLRRGLAEELAAVREELGALADRRLVTGAGAPSSTTGGAPSSTSEKAAPVAVPTDEYVITRLGTEPESEPVPALEARLFADIVLRESVVKAASFAYGVRRGLSPANRNRIWFEMRREVRRARKERKAEEREAIREWRARQRAAVRDRSREDDAA